MWLEADAEQVEEYRGLHGRGVAQDRGEGLLAGIGDWLRSLERQAEGEYDVLLCRRAASGSG